MATSTKRLSREQSRALTRERLLTAAEALFVRHGFNGTSVEEIAEQAGYTRGAFYSNFDGRDDIFLAVLDRNVDQRIKQIGEILKESPSLDQAVAAIRSGNAGRKIREWSILQTEFWLYAMRNPKVRPKLAERQRTERRAYARAIKAQFDAVGFGLPAPVEDMAAIMQIIDEGAPRQRFTDPEDVREGFFYDAMLLLFEAAVALARERGLEKKAPRTK